MDYSKPTHKMHTLLTRHIPMALLWLLLSTVVFPTGIDVSLIALLFTLSAYPAWTGGFKDLWQRSRWLWLPLLIFIGIGVFLSVMPAKSGKGAYDILRCLLLFYFIAPFLQKVSDQELLRALNYFLIPAALLYFSVVLWLQLHEGTLFIRHSELATRLFDSYHHFVSSVALASLLFLCLCINTRPGWPYAILIGTLLFYCIFFSNSRGNSLALALVALFLFTYQWRSCKQALTLSLLGFGVVLSSYLYVFYWMPCPETNCNVTVFNRQHIYHETLRLIHERPWTGYGFSVFKLISGVLEGGNKVVMPHNLLLEALYSTGLLGTLALAATLVPWFRQSGWTAKRLWSASTLPVQTQIGLALLIYLAVRGLFDLKLVDAPAFGLLAIAMAFMYARSPTH
ncbi:MAG TPA: O-antigen ligase family protein [Pseudomonadales bacterium]|nr:O-antigen ligase family protein [Pseudomonadales bacterium]